jgi:hypothetical protein
MSALHLTRNGNSDACALSAISDHPDIGRLSMRGLTFALFLALAQPHAALRVSSHITRRAVAGLVCLSPCAVHAASYDGNAVKFKERNYGDAPAPTAAPAKPVCEGRLTPDGFGGKKCVETVKTVPEKIFGGGEDAPPPPPMAAAAPKASVASPSLPPALTVDDLIANSISTRCMGAHRTRDP